METGKANACTFAFLQYRTQMPKKSSRKFQEDKKTP